MNTKSRIVHLVFKTHLDIGFTDFSNRVVQKYFDYFIPMAIDTAEALEKDEKEDRFVWTTGSWLIYEYLEQASALQRRRLEKAIEAGMIRWHGLPFTMHSEYMDASLFDFGLQLSRSLDRRFGVKTSAAKMTDVPGHTIGMLPLLAQNGIKFLHIGINAVCALPDVPPVFVWKHQDASELIVVYSNDYGGITEIPESKELLIVHHSNSETGDPDNAGPHTPAQVRAIFADLRRRYADAKIIASDLNAAASALQAVKSNLPVIEAEIGDTWIHGVGSDPTKTAQFRELSRWRRSKVSGFTESCTNTSLQKFSQRLLLIPEHTWGLDIKKHLNDWKHYDRDALHAHRSTSRYKNIEASWSEQREYIHQAITVLENTTYQEETNSRLSAIRPSLPNRRDFQRLRNPEQAYNTKHFQIAFDPDTASISYLVDRATNQLLADSTHRIGVFGYQTFSQNDYDRFLSQYHTRSTDWAVPDFSKPGIDASNAKSCWWTPEKCEVFSLQDKSGTFFILEAMMPEEASRNFGCPSSFVNEFFLPDSDALLNASLQWMQKAANRLPEAIWYSFTPRVFHPHRWYLDKMGTWVSPFTVIKNGNRSLHAVSDGVKCQDGKRTIEITTLDAPLVAPGEPKLLHFDNLQPNMDGGVHFNLYNNIWGTNFPMWFDEAAKFRFQMRIR